MAKIGWLPPLDRNSIVPLYRQIYESLRESILAGTLPESTRLPPERSLAQRLNVNRSTVVHAYRELRDLSAKQGKRFLFESTVMDGVPIFSLFDQLPAIQLKGFHGILNSTTNLILGEMEQGLSFDDALKKAQALGIAETDATHDIDGNGVGGLARNLQRVGNVELGSPAPAVQGKAGHHIAAPGKQSHFLCAGRAPTAIEGHRRLAREGQTPDAWANAPAPAPEPATAP